MLEGFCLSNALSYFRCFLTWEGVSDLGGLVECDFMTKEKPDGCCPRVKLEGPTRRGFSSRLLCPELALAKLSSAELPSGFCLSACDKSGGGKSRWVFVWVGVYRTFVRLTLVSLLLGVSRAGNSTQRSSVMFKPYKTSNGLPVVVGIASKITAFSMNGQSTSRISRHA
jgi:hypothetical protein